MAPATTPPKLPSCLNQARLTGRHAVPVSRERTRFAYEQALVLPRLEGPEIVAIRKIDHVRREAAGVEASAALARPAPTPPTAPCARSEWSNNTRLRRSGGSAMTCGFARSIHQALERRFESREQCANGPLQGIRQIGAGALRIASKCCCAWTRWPGQTRPQCPATPGRRARSGDGRGMVHKRRPGMAITNCNVSHHPPAAAYRARAAAHAPRRRAPRYAPHRAPRPVRRSAADMAPRPGQPGRLRRRRPTGLPSMRQRSWHARRWPLQRSCRRWRSGGMSGSSAMMVPARLAAAMRQGRGYAFTGMAFLRCFWPLAPVIKREQLHYQ